MFLTVYLLGIVAVIVTSIYLDVEHYKEYKQLPLDPHLLIGSILAIVWPFALMLLTIAFIAGGFSTLYSKVIALLANQD